MKDDLLITAVERALEGAAGCPLAPSGQRDATAERRAEAAVALLSVAGSRCPAQAPSAALIGAKAVLRSRAAQDSATSFTVLTAVPVISPASPPSARTRLFAWSGWAAAAVIALLWAAPSSRSLWSWVKDTLGREGVGAPHSAGPGGGDGSGEQQVNSTKPEGSAVSPAGSPSAVELDGDLHRWLSGRSGDHVTFLIQDRQRLASELKELKAAQASTFAADPRVARPTIIEMTDPTRPPGEPPKQPLAERVGSALTRELEKAASQKEEADLKPSDPSSPKPENPPKPVTDPPNPEKPAPVIYYDRNQPPVAQWEFPPGVDLVEIGGGHFYDQTHGVIMEPTGDGKTFNLRTPGPGFDPEHPRLAPVQDLSQYQPVVEEAPVTPVTDLESKKTVPITSSDPVKTVEAAKVQPEREATFLNDGFAWVDPANGTGSLILPPDVPKPVTGQTYWLWMNVPGRRDPVAVGRLDDVPASGGRIEFVLPQTGLTPGSFLLTRESDTRPSLPSSQVILKGP